MGVTRVEATLPPVITGIRVAGVPLKKKKYEHNRWNFFFLKGVLFL